MTSSTPARAGPITRALFMTTPMRLSALDRSSGITKDPANAQQQARNLGVTEFAELRGRGHSLVIDAGSAEVAATALGFVRRFT